MMKNPTEMKVRVKKKRKKMRSRKMHHILEIKDRWKVEEWIWIMEKKMKIKAFNKVTLIPILEVGQVSNKD